MTLAPRIIAIEMKVSIRTVNRVWGHRMKNRDPLAQGKFTRSKTYLNEACKRLILDISLISINEGFASVEASTKSEIPEQSVLK